MNREKLRELVKRYDEVYDFVSVKVSSFYGQFAASDNLTMDQMYALKYIVRRGRCPSSELAEACNVNRGAVTAMVNRLEAKGYVERVSDERDRRLVLLQATRRGAEVFLAVEEKFLSFAEFYLSELPEEEMEHFVRTYEKLGNIIRKVEEEGFC